MQRIGAFLSGMKGVPGQGTLVRCVPQLDFQDGNPPSYLFTSGAKNRLNPDGVHCIYFSENEETALAEYRLQWRGTKAEHQPKLTFFAELQAAQILDLTLPSLLECLDLSAEDFFGGWRTRPGTRLQQIGAWINSQERIVAARFPSNGASKAGFEGWNWAIFRKSIRHPDCLKIWGANGMLEEWP